MDEILNDWNQYKLLVTNGLEQLHQDMNKLREAHNSSMIQIAADIARLQVSTRSHARLWGLVAGSIPAIIVLLLSRFIS